MHRRHLLKLLALAPAPALAGCGATGASAPELASAEAPAPTGTFFYVSPTGDDRASGRSRTAAWQSITHVNAQLANGGIGVYDTVLFEGGQTHFGKIRIPRGRPTGGGYLTIGAYPGGRRRPVISSYTLLNKASDWRRTG
ncbi:MAG TPA: hypothetical protein VGP05_17935, partial [Pseudonocardia sp.]|nr:hypothetical protein [Pseudonocardia sp.]